MTQVLAKEDRYHADFIALEASLPGGQPQWLTQLRQQAWTRFSEVGFPTARRGNEEWKYTSVAPIANATFEHPSNASPGQVSAAEVRRLAPWDSDWINLVFVDGRYSEALSATPVAPNGIVVKSLAEAVVADGDLVEAHLSRHALVEANGFIALNTAFIQDGAFVHVPDDHVSANPLHLLFLTTERGRPTASHPRTLILAGRHSKLSVIESYVTLSEASYFTNAVAEIELGEGAQVEHYRLLMDSPAAFHVGTTRVHQGQDSAFSSTSFAMASALARNDLHVTLDAPGSSCSLNGLYLTAGTQHIDNHIGINHAKPHTTSHQYYKGILGGKSRAVFSGKVVVQPDAQKAWARQTDRNLLLSEGAEADSSPSLEILADDVNCTHGATTGQIDEDTIFYMRSRGLDLETARGLMINAFASEIIDTVTLAPLRAYLERWISEALPSLQAEATS